MIKNIYKINQHWIGNYPIKCCPKRLIYIKTFFCTMQCYPINLFTLEPCLKNYFWNACFFERWYFAFNFILVTRDWKKCVKPTFNCYPIECYLNDLTSIKQIFSFSSTRSYRNKPFFLDLDLKVFVPWLLLGKNMEHNVWNQN